MRWKIHNLQSHWSKNLFRHVIIAPTPGATLLHLSLRIRGFTLYWTPSHTALFWSQQRLGSCCVDCDTLLTVIDWWLCCFRFLWCEVMRTLTVIEWRLCCNKLVSDVEWCVRWQWLNGVFVAIVWCLVAEWCVYRMCGGQSVALVWSGVVEWCWLASELCVWERLLKCCVHMICMPCFPTLALRRVSSLTAQPLTTIGCFYIITHAQKKWLITHAQKEGQYW